MHTNRLEQLFSLLAESPEDAFTYYAIALEYGKLNEVEKMRAYFEKLLAEFPTYLPTYYHVGKLYEELGEISLAKQTFEAGIVLAQNQQDHFALRELKGAYEMFLLDYEEG